MTGKRRPLPQGWRDAVSIAAEAQSQGIPCKAGTLKKQMERGVRGVASDITHPQRRLIVPERAAQRLIREAWKRQFIQRMVGKGKAILLSRLALELGMKEKSLLREGIAFTIAPGIVTLEEANRLRAKYKQAGLLKTKYIGLKKAARELGVGTPTLRKWAQDGLIPTIAVAEHGLRINKIPRASWERVKQRLKQRAGYNEKQAGRARHPKKRKS